MQCTHSPSLPVDRRLWRTHVHFIHSLDLTHGSSATHTVLFFFHFNLTHGATWFFTVDTRLLLLWWDTPHLLWNDPHCGDTRQPHLLLPTADRFFKPLHRLALETVIVLRQQSSISTTHCFFFVIRHADPLRHSWRHTPMLLWRQASLPLDAWASRRTISSKCWMKRSVLVQKISLLEFVVVQLLLLVVVDLEVWVLQDVVVVDAHIFQLFLKTCFWSKSSHSIQFDCPCQLSQQSFGHCTAWGWTKLEHKDLWLLSLIPHWLCHLRHLQQKKELSVWESLDCSAVMHLPASVHFSVSQTFAALPFINWFSY